MNKMFRDLVLSFVISFMYVLFANTTGTVAGDLLISVAAAGVFSLYGGLVRCLVEGYIAMDRKASEEELANRFQVSLVVRDSLLVFALVYGFMTSNFGLGLSIGETIGYLVAALAPTLVVAILSKEIRLPFLREYRQHDVVVNGMGFNKAA